MSGDQIDLEVLRSVNGPPALPFGLVLALQLRTAAAIGIDSRETIVLRDGRLALFSRAEQAPWEGGASFEVKVVGFESAAAAEDEAAAVVASLQPAAVRGGLPLLIKTAPSAFDQRESWKGRQARMYGTVGWSSERFARFLNDARDDVVRLDAKSRLTLELLVASELETSERARFIMCVSALEPLVERQSLDECVSRFVEKSATTLDAVVTPKHGSYDSLRTRLSNLGKESIGQATHRIVLELLRNDEESATIVKKAYDIRSQLLHTGKTRKQTDLAQERRKVIEIIRRLLDSKTGRA